MPIHHERLRAPAVAIAAVALFLAACGGPSTKSETIDFGAATDTPGMAGMAGSGHHAPMTAPSDEARNPSTGKAAAPTGPNVVNIENFKFGPKALTVKVGTTVTWTNHDEEPHTVVAEDNSFHSAGLDAGDTYSFTFTKAGTFPYVCSIHPFMHGTVVVTG